MAEYNKRQLLELVAGVFKCSPNEKAFYGSVNGTFLNQEQYDKLDTKDKGGFDKFENPKFAGDGEKRSADDTKKAEAEAKKAAAAEIAAKKAAEAEEKKAKQAAAKAAKKADADKKAPSKKAKTEPAAE